MKKLIFYSLFLSGCYGSSSHFCSNLAEEYNSLAQAENEEIHSWDNLYVHHNFLIKSLLEDWKNNSIEKEKFFSLTFYAFLRSHSVLECGAKPETNMIFSEEEEQNNNLPSGLTKIKTESHPYFKCLRSEWKKQARPLIFKSCKYYFTH